MRSWYRNLRDIGWSWGATRNEGLGPNSTCSAPNLRRAPTRPEATTTLEARKRFSDQRRPPDQQAIVGKISGGAMVRRTRNDSEPVGDIKPTGQKGLATASSQFR